MAMATDMVDTAIPTINIKYKFEISMASMNGLDLFHPIAG